MASFSKVYILRHTNVDLNTLMCCSQYFGTEGSISNNVFFFVSAFIVY